MNHLPILLRVAGAGLLVLAFLHLPIARRLRWREEAARMSDLNAVVFHVHAFFVVLVLIMMGLPALVEPTVYLDPTRPGLWACTMIAFFWTCRLIAQWSVYRPSWWKGLPFETAMHWFFTFVWLFLALLFSACAARQAGWL